MTIYEILTYGILKQRAADQEAMLLKQKVAIKQLREELDTLVKDTNDEYIPSRLCVAAMPALAATEGFK